MIRSMTGFGRCRETVDHLDITVEIRSVNGRFFDCSVHLSRSYSYLEERIKPYLQACGVARGKVDVSVSIEPLQAADTELYVDEAYLKQYLSVLYRLRDTYGLKDDISVMTLARNTELIRSCRPTEDTERDWECTKAVLQKALDAFLLSREQEGTRLEADLAEKLSSVRARVEEIESLSSENTAGYRERLTERIRESLADNQITPDETRLLTECAIHADKVAVDEELVRLRTHLSAFSEILSGKEPVGRRLDFLLQELNREINTVGSKCNDAKIAHLVVDVKCELEKIREQIQNLE